MEPNIEALEKRLWTAADQLRANSDFASNEYFLPVMGLIFLRHGYSRYLAVKPEIEAGLPNRSHRPAVIVRAAGSSAENLDRTERLLRVLIATTPKPSKSARRKAAKLRKQTWNLGPPE
ncbi:hypothetical protein [Bradyrhizobium sp. JYMT SZCCT0180]|uniref:hypothetical protein n=1 Tax=Bradyrhizobium sp. JYMT SZCCT0180 TaxID=2807666 RepID=UPI001BA4F9FD|nr:hypothetical protein [Bradyrhizobium sp. JYMT SZCCT0180]MBR1216183.1 hypothetical protein [Bradyrhizobium sp. JYMT SZCCT0180]